MKCQSIKNNIKKICTADFNKKITIQYISTSGSNNPSAVIEQVYTNMATIFAMVKTSPVVNLIGNVNINQTISVDFYIRYNSAIDTSKQLYILLDNKRFSVQTIDNIDKDDRIIRFRATELGLSTLGANKF